VKKTMRAQTKTAHYTKKMHSKEQRMRDAWVTFLYGSIGHTACGRKQRYNSLAEANAKMLKNQLRWNNPDVHATNAYKCPFCQGWHMTHLFDAPKDGWDAYIEKAMLHKQKVLRLAPAETKIPLTYAATNIQNKTIKKLRKQGLTLDKSQQRGRLRLSRKQRKLQDRETEQEIQELLCRSLKAKEPTRIQLRLPKPAKPRATTVYVLKHKKKGRR
jgi:hypothetical protein